MRFLNYLFRDKQLFILNVGVEVVENNFNGIFGSFHFYSPFLFVRFCVPHLFCDFSIAFSKSVSVVIMEHISKTKKKKHGQKSTVLSLEKWQLKRCLKDVIFLFQRCIFLASKML